MTTARSPVNDPLITVGASNVVTFTIKNSSLANLTGLAITKDAGALSVSGPSRRRAGRKP